MLTQAKVHQMLIFFSTLFSVYCRKCAATVSDWLHNSCTVQTEHTFLIVWSMILNKVNRKKTKTNKLKDGELPTINEKDFHPEFV